MEEIKLPSGVIIELYSSIKEMPIKVSKEFQKYILQDLGIGSTISDIDEHLEKLFLLIQRNDQLNALEEAKNLRYNMFTMVSDIDFHSLSFGCLVAKVSGEKQTDNSPDTINKLVEVLSENGLTNEIIDEYLENIKKNLTKSGHYISQSSLETAVST